MAAERTRLLCMNYDRGNGKQAPVSEQARSRLTTSNLFNISHVNWVTVRVNVLCILYFIL
jgi:hypothetical protein